jgi:hypothetical protein
MHHEILDLRGCIWDLASASISTSIGPSVQYCEVIGQEENFDVSEPTLMSV